MSAIDDVLTTIRDHDVKYMDFRFTDPRGKWQHLAHHVRTVTPELLADGVMFDGSSIAGWKPINESDMLLVPDCAAAMMDPFATQTTLIVFCDVHEPLTGQPYARDPRSTAKKKAERRLVASGIGDRAFFGSEPEFFVFDDVRYESAMHTASYTVDTAEGPWASNKQFSGGNSGHRPPVHGGYVPVPPIDSQSDLRAEMLCVMEDMGLDVEKHHHEVTPGQHELCFAFSTLVRTADHTQIYKYVVQNVAHQYGKTATFMPKPIMGDNASGMHVSQSIWDGERPLFAGDLYGGLSETALFYIGGVIKHAKALNAFTNPTTNSYKRLVAGFEAPVLLAYSAGNRSAACRIPHSASPKGRRVEVRFPDPAANPYLAYAALLLAGVDGIKHKIHPGEAMDKNLYDLGPQEQKNIPTVCNSLREAIASLEADHAFLLSDDIFTQDQIQAYIDLKWEEVYNFEHTPHPIEFSMYYSV